MEQLVLSLTPKPSRGVPPCTKACSAPVFLTQTILRECRACPVCSCSQLLTLCQDKSDGDLMEEHFSHVCPVIFYILLLCMSRLIISRFPSSPIYQNKFAIFQSLTIEDLNRLQPQEWLNDELVNAGIKSVICLHPATFLLIIPRQWLLVEHLRPDHSVHAMGTFFYGLWRSDVSFFSSSLRCSSLFKVAQVVDMIVSNAGSKLTSCCQPNIFSSRSTSTKSV
jgi:hypothetical protein